MTRSELWYNCGVETTRPILYGVADYAAQCGFDAEKAYDTAIRWYDNYRFGSASAPSVANTTLVLSLFSYLWRTKQFPKEFIDENLRTDYAKIRHLVTLNNRLNGNFHVLESLIAGGELTERLAKSFQSTLVALLVASGGPYFVKHEREAGGGFYDIALEPQLSRWPEIAHAALIEMKYVKAGDPAPTPEQLEKIKAEAIIQLDQYSADPALIAEWHIGTAAGSDKSVASPKGTTLGEAALSPLHDGAALPCVALHRLVLVFHGGEFVLSEEV